MKPLLVLIVGLLAVGCATLTPEQKQKALKDSVVGEYEHKNGKHTVKWVLLESLNRQGKAACERWLNHDNKTTPFNRVAIYGWTIENGEIHIEAAETVTWVLRINTDRSVTYIAQITKGKREGNAGLREQWTAKKSK